VALTAHVPEFVDEPQLSVNIKLPSGSDLVFDLDPLSHDIDPSRSSFRPLSSKVEIKLAKAKAGIKWANIEGDEGDAVPMCASRPPRRPSLAREGSYGRTASTNADKKGPSYPPSARHKPNWDQLAREAAEEDAKPADLKADPNAGGDRELNKLFQKLYADATDDQRKAMMKSYQESNGTSLSTNWDDVRKKRVETVPPDVRRAASVLSRGFEVLDCAAHSRWWPSPGIRDRAPSVSRRTLRCPTVFPLLHLLHV
jgi:suppressor of G2 allele of SKP1